MKEPGHLGVLVVLLALFTATGCPGCKEPDDPCEHVECPEGEICIDGECAPDPCAGVECPPGQICVEGSCFPYSCSTSADCPWEAPICDDGTCRPCERDAECEDGRICEGGRCVEGPGPCTSDDDCDLETRPYCDTGRAVCVACTHDAHCPVFGQICNRATGECVLPAYCLADEDCADESRPFCEPLSGLCVECLEDDHCDISARQTCNELTWSCEDFVPCTDDTDCSANPEAPRCEPASGECVACVEDEDCIEGTTRTCDYGSWTCTGGIPCVHEEDCVDPALSRCDTRIGFCVDCLSSADCETPGATCDLERRSCREPVPCSGDDDCPEDATPLCNTETGFCVECLTPDDCSSTVAACVGGICDPGPPNDGRPGSPCAASSDCELSTTTDQYAFCWGMWEDEWKWYRGYCTAICDSDGDCPAGAMCLGGVCWDRCTSSTQCRPGYACQALTDGVREAQLCSPACDPAIARDIPCESDRDCDLGICDAEAGHCVCSPVGGPCTGLGFCGPRAHCLLETRDGEPTGFAGGYCIILDCGEPGAPPCPPGSSCYSIADTTACLPDCDPNLPGSCERAPYGCDEVPRYVLGGSCLSGADCPAKAPDCLAAPGELGTCVRLCEEDADCDFSRGHQCVNIERQIFLCADPFHMGICFPGCAHDTDCGGCAVDDDCPAGHVCDAGACRRPCSSAAECPDQACVRGYCAAPCVDSTDCPRGSSCLDGGCSPVSYRCDPVTRRCDPPCRHDLDCDRARTCDTESGRCITPCDDESFDCGPAGRCNTMELVCELDCRTLDGACVEDHFCSPISGYCEPRCGRFGEGSCDPSLRCDVLTGRCVLPCADVDRPCTHSTVEEDCEPDEACEYGYCAKRCDTDLDCEPGLHCHWGVCTTCDWPRWRCDAEGTGLCFSCYEDIHCSTNRYCDIGGTYECVERCGDVQGGTATCPAGMVCDVLGGGRCVTPCATSADCEDDPNRPHCHAETGLCGECRLDEHCTGDARPRCSPDIPECVACLEDEDCEGSPHGPACHPEELSCVECTSDDHCEGSQLGELCQVEWSICVECFEDADCPSTRPLCDTEALVCLGCFEHDQCREGDLCHPGLEECHPPCGDLPADRARTGSVDGGATNTFVDEDGAAAGSILFVSQDGIYAFSPASETSAQVNLIGFPFSIPQDATVTGIAVSVVAATHGQPADDDWWLSARLLDSGGPVGEAREAALTDSDTLHVLGGDLDTWGSSWTVEGVNDHGFGALIEVVDLEVSAQVRARVDHVFLTVHYTLPGETDCAELEVIEEEPLYCREDNVCDIEQ